MKSRRNDGARPVADGNYARPAAEWRRRGRMEPEWCVHYRRHRQPGGAEAARPPAPSVTVDENPIAVMERQPSPRISRNPSESEAWIPNPSAIEKRMPVRRNIIRPPYRPVSRQCIEVAIVGEVINPVVIRRV